MLSRLLYIFVCLLFTQSLHSQMIESNSRPYRFNIEQMLTLESSSIPIGFDIEPFRTKIVDQLEIEIALWYDQIGYKFADDANFEEKLRAEVEVIQPGIIHAVGIEAMSKSTPQLYFIPEELKFEIYFNGFEPFEIEVPMAQVEDFKENFSRIKFVDQQITYNELDHFVITEINVYDPVSDAIYAYQRYDSDVLQAPVFPVSLPTID
jgi:hypothetical protein